MIYRDDIIVEVWRNRDAYVARHHNSLTEMVADLRERQQQPNCKLVDRRKMSQAGYASRPSLRHGGLEDR